MRKAQYKARVVIVGMIAFHLACFGAIYTGVSTTALAVAGALYVLRASASPRAFTACSPIPPTAHRARCASC